jgi:hypothetical protein
LDDLVARLATARARRAVAVAVVVLCAVDGLAFDWYCFRDVFFFPIQPAGPAARFFPVRGDWRSMMQHVLAGHGAIGCDEEAPLQRAEELDEGDVPQVRLDDPSAGELRALRWTPNRVEVEVALARPATVLINENWNEHWKSDVGQVVKVGPKLARDRDGGRLGVEAPAGTYTLTAYYRPRSFLVGAAVSGLAAPVLFALFFALRRRS